MFASKAINILNGQVWTHLTNSFVIYDNSQIK